MRSGERKRTSLKVIIAKIDDSIRELRGLDYVGDKWALIADRQRVRNDLDTKLESRHDALVPLVVRGFAPASPTRSWEAK